MAIKKQKLKKEASMAGATAGSQVSDIKGFSAPFGSRAKSNRGRKRKKNPSKPFGEAEIFESMVARTMLDSPEEFDEVVRKRGNMWIYYDDETEAEKGSWRDRETAWEKQRIDRRHKAAQNKLNKSKRNVEKNADRKGGLVRQAFKTQGKKKAKPKGKKAKVESLMQMLKPLKEGSMLSYVFENTPVSDESITWEKFVNRLSKQTVMSDPKLKQILQNMAKSEGKMLEKSVAMLAKNLNAAGKFDVQKKNVEIEPDTKDVKLNFSVQMVESKTKVDLAIKLENGRPLILFPDETRNTLNNLATDESKLLRAELMHFQETILDNMTDVLSVTQKRDKYLKQLEAKADKLLNTMNSLEMSMVRYLLKNKYKGVK